jgi:hypothetical protein
MPAVLVLFAIALVITLIGLFLSPKSQASRAQDNRRIVPGEVRATRTPPASGRPRVKRVSDMLEPDVTTKILKARASQTQAQVRVVKPQAARVQRAAALTVDGGIWGRLSSWKVAIPGLLAIFLLSFYLLNVAGPRPLLWVPAFFGSTNDQATPLPTATTAPTYTATEHLARLGQLDPAQYRTMQEYNTWSYSACSAASMTEVINSYGHTYRITDILAVESRIHEITPQEGLLEEVGIQNTGRQFGFKTTWGHNLSLDQVIAAAKRGTPVIVSFPPYKYPPGHILVVRGGSASMVYLADSSGLNWTQLTRTRFMQLWGGFYAIMTPS